MLSYQHAYHIGNRPDVLKHAMLAMALDHMTQKPAPLTYWDAHAGRGLYPVKAVETQKIKEYEQGFAKVWPWDAAAPEQLAPLAKAYGAYGEDVMAGSPAIAAALLRPTDKLELTELHPGESGFLKQAFKADPRARMRKLDGPAYIVEGLVAPVGPERKASEADEFKKFANGQRTVGNQGRHFVLLDPSYELKDDYENVVKTARKILMAAPKATIQIWYPLMADLRHEVLEDAASELKANGVFAFAAEWDAPEGMMCMGTGNILINPPFGKTDSMEAGLAWLCEKMAIKAAPYGLVVPHM